jgi:hypothetical protein
MKWNNDMNTVPRDGTPVLLKIQEYNGEIYPSVGIMFPLNEMDNAKWYSLSNYGSCKSEKTNPIAWCEIE